MVPHTFEKGYKPITNCYNSFTITAKALTREKCGDIIKEKKTIIRGVGK